MDTYLPTARVRLPLPANSSIKTKREPASYMAPGPVGGATEIDDNGEEDEGDELHDEEGPGAKMGAFTTPEQSTPDSGAHAPPQAVLFLPLFPPLPLPFPPLPPLPARRGNICATACRLNTGQLAWTWSGEPQVQQPVLNFLTGCCCVWLLPELLLLRFRGLRGLKAEGEIDETLGFEATSGRIRSASRDGNDGGADDEEAEDLEPRRARSRVCSCSFHQSARGPCRKSERVSRMIVRQGWSGL